MAARLGLDLDIILRRALDDSGHIVGGVWPDNGGRIHVDGEVVWLNPVFLIQGVVREGHTARSPIADIAQTGLERGAVRLAHGINSLPRPRNWARVLDNARIVRPLKGQADYLL